MALWAKIDSPCIAASSMQCMTACKFAGSCSDYGETCGVLCTYADPWQHDNYHLSQKAYPKAAYSLIDAAPAAASSFL